MTVRLVLHSPIPVVRSDEGFFTLDLWAVDLDEQCRHVDSVTLLCPVWQAAPDGWQGTARLPTNVSVVDVGGLDDAALERLLAHSDVVQTYGGQGWRASATCRRLVREARRHGVASVVGLSSNRARTRWLNSRPRTLRAGLAWGRTLVAYAGLRATYQWLTANADGTFIVGEGLRSLVAAACPSVHVGTASWVRAADLARLRDRPTPDPATADARARRLCIASRLERMKGVHIGIAALAALRDAGRGGDVTLAIYGAGPERDRLEAQVSEAGLAAQVVFAGTLAYPSPFLDRLETHGVVVLPNLNDEQPRLLFDAIGRGCLPVCPDTVAYRALGVPDAIRFRVGDSSSLAETLGALLADAPSRERIATALLAIAEVHTLESMHGRRSAWIREVIARRRAAGASVALDPATRVDP